MNESQGSLTVYATSTEEKKGIEKEDKKLCQSQNSKANNQSEIHFIDSKENVKVNLLSKVQNIKEGKFLYTI